MRSEDGSFMIYIQQTIELAPAPTRPHSMSCCATTRPSGLRAPQGARDVRHSATTCPKIRSILQTPFNYQVLDLGRGAG